jgi:hypothetical protein
MLTKLGQRGYAVHETGAAYKAPIDPDTDTDPDPEFAASVIMRTADFFGGYVSGGPGILSLR